MAAILDLEVNVTSNMYLSPRDGFIKTKLVKNNTLLAKIPHLIPEILNFYRFQNGNNGRWRPFWKAILNLVDMGIFFDTQTHHLRCL